MFSSEDPIEWYFHQAIQKEDPKERGEWLQSVLGNDPETLRRVRELIDDFEKASWMDRTPLVIQEACKFIEDAADLVGKQIGPFHLLKLLGSGGMGDVYLARQLYPIKRQVALKLISRKGEHQQIVERFKREMQMLASMDHPNIARILDAGTTESGTSYIAMEYVDGIDLFEFCRSNRLEVRTRIALFHQCCRAIQHAHQRGIIHRDIKPSNVMVTRIDGEAIVKVIDFGIAKASLSDSVCESNDYSSSIVSVLSHTITSRGYSPGTPPYMSPEQFIKDNAGVDIRSDIYSLGALLYVLLTEQKPFDQSRITGRSLEDIGEMVSKEDPPLPSERAPAIASVLRGDIDAIVRKSMNRDVEKRYQSVVQLLEDLRHYLAGETVSCNRGSSWSQFRRFTRRNRLLFGAAAIALAGLLLALMGLSAGWIVAIRQKEIAISDARDANLLESSIRVQRGEYRTAFDTLARVSLKDQRASSRLDYRLLRSQVLEPPTEYAKSAAKIYFGLSIPSRRAIACGGQDSTVKILDWNTREEIWSIATEQKEVNGLAVSPDGRFLATAGDDGTVKVWGLDTKRLHSLLDVSKKGVFQVAWSPDGRQLITAASEPNARVWSFPEGQLQHVIDSLGCDLECITSNPNGDFAFGDYKGRVWVGHFDRLGQEGLGGKQAEAIFTKYEACSSVAFSNSGRFLAIGLKSGFLVLLLKTDSGYQTFEQIRFSSDVTSLAFSSDERRLAIGESTGGLHVLSLKEGISGESRFVFTEKFFELHADQLGGGTDGLVRRRGISSLLTSTDPPEAMERLPFTTDRIKITLKEPLRNVVFPDQFSRKWIDPSTGEMTGRFEAPIRVSQDDLDIELLFQSPGSQWGDPLLLKEQRRLISWSAHAKRVSGVDWGEADREVFSFSEDQSIRKSRLQAYLPSLIDSNADGVHPVDKDHLILLDKDLFRIVAREYAPNVHKYTDLQVDFCEPGELFRIANGAFGLYWAKRNPGGSLSRGSWEIFEWDPDRKQAVQMVRIPEQYHLEHLIGTTGNNRWLCRLSRSGDSRPPNRKPAFLALIDADGTFVWEKPPDTEPFRYSDISPDANYLVYENSGKIMKVSLADGQEDVLYTEPDLSVSHMKISPDSKLLAVALNKERAIRCIQLEGSRSLPLWEMQEHGGQTTEVAWSKDQSILLTISRDGRLRTYNLDSRRLSAEISLSFSDPKHLRVSDDEQAVFVLARSGAVLRLPCPQATE